MLCLNCYQSFAPSLYSFHECNAPFYHTNDQGTELFDTASKAPSPSTLHIEDFHSPLQDLGFSLPLDPWNTIASPDLPLSDDLEPRDFFIELSQNAVSPYGNHAEVDDNEGITNTALSHSGNHCEPARESDYWPLATLFTDNSDIDPPDNVSLCASHPAGQRMAPCSRTAYIVHAQHPKDQADQLHSFHCTLPSKYAPEETCGAKFSQRRELDRHSRSVHPRSEDPMYWCKCCYKCARKDNYVRHVKKCNGKGLQRDDYGCVCGFLSVTKEHLLGHLRGCRRSRSTNGPEESPCTK